MFIAVAVYGWNRWRQAEQAGAAPPRRRGHRAALGRATSPGWAWRPRSWPAPSALTPSSLALGSYAPVWADAWTFVGSLLATYGMARGWSEFWLIWVAVDIVGVPLLFSAGYYASAFMYLFYGGLHLGRVLRLVARVERPALRSPARLPDAAQPAQPRRRSGRPAHERLSRPRPARGRGPRRHPLRAAQPASAPQRRGHGGCPAGRRRRARGARTRWWAPS